MLVINKIKNKVKFRKGEMYHIKVIKEYKLIQNLYNRI